MADFTLRLNVSNAIALNSSTASMGQNLDDSTGYLHSTSIRRTPFNMTFASLAVADPNSNVLAKKRPKRHPVHW
jgi:hypothetical protein